MLKILPFEPSLQHPMNSSRCAFLCCFLFLLTGSVKTRGDTPQWIWHHNKSVKANEVCFLRKTFHLDSMPSKASLRVAADDEAIVYLNGHEVAHSQGYKDPAAQDVTDQLEKGANVLAIRSQTRPGE